MALIVCGCGNNTFTVEGNKLTCANYRCGKVIEINPPALTASKAVIDPAVQKHLEDVNRAIERTLIIPSDVFKGFSK